MHNCMLSNLIVRLIGSNMHVMIRLQLACFQAFLYNLYAEFMRKKGRGEEGYSVIIFNGYEC